MNRSRVALALCAVLLLACRPPAEGPPGQEGPGGPMVLSPESVHAVKREVIQTGPRISGSLEARQQASLRAEVPGAVTEVNAELGDPVKADQVLARIEDKGQRDSVTSSRSGLA